MSAGAGGAVPSSGIGHLRIVVDETAYIGPGRRRLLELIGETGSIAEAGRRMDMSYKRAWSLVRALNTGFGFALVETTRGGTGQGGASLTAAGQEVLARYRAVEAAAAAATTPGVQALRAFVVTMRKPLGRSE